MSCSKHTLAVKATVLDRDPVRYAECPIDRLASIMHPSLAYWHIYLENWGSGVSPFIQEEVPRDDKDVRINVKVPKKTWAFCPDSAISDFLFERLRTRPFVRREYEQALSDILEVVRTGKKNITVGNEDEYEAEPEEQDIGEEEHIDQMSLDPAVTDTKRFREEESDFANIREQKKRHLGTTFDIGNQVGTIDESPVEYLNPFQEVDSESALKAKGFVIMGHPGIGKTIFLYYVLLLRLQASQPTILVTHPDKVTIFLRHGVFFVSMTDFEDVMHVIPTNAWCLVDANETALPKRKHLRWANKTIGILRYVMKPFSLSELIIGYENFITSFTSLSDFDVVRRNRSLDVSETISEKSLQEYYRQYTPSARFAYQHAGNLDKYTRFVRGLFGQLTVNRMEKPINVDSGDEQILYHILTVRTVEAGGQRSVPQIEISSHHLGQLITDDR
ncbi:hypothetical protein ARMGADRAFT_1080759 [Armillaria gallica]|uniref:Uncharacterized protein n=1 Tax=Armillaria gallica TaxID=47427 RepID=A0A2H3DBS8_ARMGA|nr:hypothetical protein ARMGADRAFT_1080759 [Armillaria gallica]